MPKIVMRTGEFFLFEKEDGGEWKPLEESPEFFEWKDVNEALKELKEEGFTEVAEYIERTTNEIKLMEFCFCDPTIEG